MKAPRVLAIDPGAKRAGWAVLEMGPKYIASGVEEFPRGDLAYQMYRMKLTRHWVGLTAELLDKYEPNHVVTETVPVYGMNDFSQGYLALVMCVTVHALSMALGTEATQVSATKVQKAIATGGRSAKRTKVQVRNGVISLLPELEKEYGKTKVYEATDAIAIGLHFLGYSNT